MAEQVTAAQLKTMTAEQIVAAQQEGRLNSLLGHQQTDNKQE